MGLVVQLQKLKSHFWINLFPERSRILSEKEKTQQNSTPENLAEKTYPGEEQCFLLEVQYGPVPSAKEVPPHGGALKWGHLTTGTGSTSPRSPWGWWEGCSNEGFLPLTTLVCIKSSSHFYTLYFLQKFIVIKRNFWISYCSWNQVQVLISGFSGAFTSSKIHYRDFLNKGHMHILSMFLYYF